MPIDQGDTRTHLAIRRAVLTLSIRRQQASSGSDLQGLLRRKTVTMQWRRDADQALAAVPHAVVGAVAAAAQVNLIDGLPILPLPYLTLMKLLASRIVDTGDLTRMLGRQDAATLAAVRQVITEHGRPEDVADLEQIIALGRLEYGGPRAG